MSTKYNNKLSITTKNSEKNKLKKQIQLKYAKHLTKQNTPNIENLNIVKKLSLQNKTPVKINEKIFIENQEKGTETLTSEQLFPYSESEEKINLNFKKEKKEISLHKSNLNENFVSENGKTRSETINKMYRDIVKFSDFNNLIVTNSKSS